MKTAVYYFSGTGNSYIIARDLARELAAELIPIAALSGSPTVILEADTAGIVFPVYYGNLPVIVRQFAEKLENISGVHIFAVCTFGGGAGDSLTALGKILKQQGGRLSASFGIHMPQNAFFKPWENYERIYARWNKNLSGISKRILSRKKGSPFKTVLPWLLLFPFHKLFLPAYRKSLAELSGVSSELPISTIIHHADNSFRVSDACSGCGLCAKVCPADNIRIVEKRPVWQNRCENCIACYNWCPVRAVEGGMAHEGYFYHHPGVSSADIIRQKQYL